MGIAIDSRVRDESDPDYNLLSATQAENEYSDLMSHLQFGSPSSSSSAAGGFNGHGSRGSSEDFEVVDSGSVFGVEPHHLRNHHHASRPARNQNQIPLLDQ